MPAAPASPLVLGTAQFGLPYGVANATTLVELDVVDATVARARERGVGTLDTAVGYGVAEERLGRIGVADFAIVTKLPAVPEIGALDAWVHQTVSGSLARLGVDRLGGVLCHRAADVTGPRAGELLDALAGLVDAGLADAVGVSVYAPAQVPGSRVIELVQAPGSVVDRRLASALGELSSAGRSVHVRSVLLQGLLTLEHDERPARFAPWTSVLDAVGTWARSCGVSHVDACLRGALHLHPGCPLVVGCVGPDQLDDLVDAATAGPLAPPATLEVTDLDLLDPTRWEAP